MGWKSAPTGPSESERERSQTAEGASFPERSSRERQAPSGKLPTVESLGPHRSSKSRHSRIVQTYALMTWASTDDVP